LKYGPLQAGFSKTPSRVTYSTATILPTVLILLRVLPSG
jgi:hypothetical protein